MIIQLINVRLAFPHLFEAQVPADGKGTPKYNAALLFPPDHPARKLVNDGIIEIAKAKWGVKADVILKSMIAANGICLRNGDTKAEYEGYPGNYFVNASNKVRPTVVNRDKSPLTAADGKPYAGCYVNASIELWAQDNQYGKKVNASLRGVQFVGDGDAFAGGGVSSADEFASLEDGAGAVENSLV